MNIIFLALSVIVLCALFIWSNLKLCDLESRIDRITRQMEELEEETL